ncbi:hypothetical protein J8L85_01605 [Maribacter sp. MMG018]|uniref:hypothetical protein n=1 Tax=Maribacter sp. MMG018 TaxID=2822688 RepID=UPI001B36AD91|nr:hypothetical protein [Maribacter sp. MMG018]MBQ4913114.1 hypothetical protein [Maribacter sp. MMG018]
MKKVVFLVFILGYSFMVMAQRDAPDLFRSYENNLQFIDNSPETNPFYLEAEGSPYINDKFKPAIIYPDNKPFLVRYNAKDDRIEVQLKEGKFLSLDNQKRDYGVVMKETGTVYQTLYSEGVKMAGYFIEVVNGKNVSVYKKQVKKFVEGKDASENYGVEKPPYFTDPENIFFVQLEPNGKIQELPKRKKSFIKLFKENEGAVKKYLSDHKINLSNESDIKKVITYINTLYS